MKELNSNLNTNTKKSIKNNFITINEAEEKIIKTNSLKPTHENTEIFGNLLEKKHHFIEVQKLREIEYENFEKLKNKFNKKRIHTLNEEEKYNKRKFTELQAREMQKQREIEYKNFEKMKNKFNEKSIHAVKKEEEYFRRKFEELQAREINLQENIKENTKNFDEMEQSLQKIQKEKEIYLKDRSDLNELLQIHEKNVEEHMKMVKEFVQDQVLLTHKMNLETERLDAKKIKHQNDVITFNDKKKLFITDMHYLTVKFKRLKTEKFAQQETRHNKGLKENRKIQNNEINEQFKKKYESLDLSKFGFKNNLKKKKKKKKTLNKYKIGSKHILKKRTRKI